MATSNVGNWWLLALKGLFAIIVGVLIFVRPIEALLGITLFIGIMALLGGVALIAYSISNRKHLEEWGWLLAEGIFDILIGIAIVGYPAFSALLLTSLLGVWFILSGIFQLIYYSRLRRRAANRQVVLVNGIITILLGLVIVINPFGGALGLTLVVGVTAILYGLLQIYTAFRYREIASNIPPLYNEHSIQP